MFSQTKQIKKNIQRKYFAFFVKLIKMKITCDMYGSVPKHTLNPCGLSLSPYSHDITPL